MKDFFKIIVVAITVGFILMIGLWGIQTFLSDTQWWWLLFGGIVGYALIGKPIIRFWNKKISNLLDLEL